MKISKVIYRLKSIAKTLDFEGGEDNVTALNIAIDFLSENLRDDQFNAAIRHVSVPLKGRSGNTTRGISGILKTKTRQSPHCAASEAS